MAESSRGVSLNAWGGAMYPALAEWLADVRALLPHHQPLFATSDAGPVTDADGRQHRQAFGLATFAADHLMIIGAKVAPVHRAFTDHTTWPRDDRPRTACALRLVEPGATRAVVLVHLHGLRDRRGKSDTLERRAQATRIADLVQGLREPDDLVVVCGDLNLLPNSDMPTIRMVDPPPG